MARVRKRSHTESAEIAEAMDATDAVTEKSSSSDDEAGADDEEDESEAIMLLEGKTKKYKWKMTGQTFVDGGRRYKPTPDMPKVGDMELTFMYDSMDEILEAPVYKDLDEEHKKAFKKAAPGMLGAAYGVYMARRISKAAPDVLDAEKGVNIEGDAQFFDHMQTALGSSAFEALNRTEHFGEKGPSSLVVQSFLAYLETCANHAKFQMTNSSLKEHEL